MTFSTVLLFFVVAPGAFASASTNSSFSLFSPDSSCNETETRVHRHVCLREGYSKMDRPKKSLDVALSFLLKDVSSVDDEAMTVTLSLFLTMTWTEPRIRFIQGPKSKGGGGSSEEEEEEEEEDEEDEHTSMSLDPELGDPQLWKPDLFVDNLVDFEVKSVLSPVGGTFVYPIPVEGKSGSTSVAARVSHWFLATVTFACRMQFDSFPYDEQECRFRVGSSRFTEQEVDFTWKYDFARGGEEMLKNTKAFKIELEDLHEGEDEVYVKEHKNTFARAGFRLRLTRRWGPFVFKYFLPCFGLVLISWMSFAIAPEAVPGRVALLITLFLVLTTFFINIQTQTPNAQGLTALGIYILTCLLFVFFAMMEFAVLLVYIRRSEAASASAFSSSGRTVKRSLRPATSKNSWPMMSEDSGMGASNFAAAAKCKEFGYKFDRLASVVAAALFALFNFVYVVYYAA